MKRKLACLFLGVALVLPASARAGDALTEALAAIPGDAIGFVCVPSIKGLDGDYQQAIINLELQPFVQPPMNSLVGLLKQYMPMLEGIDENGPLTIVFMPAANPFELMMKQALLIPVEDPQAMIEKMGGVAGEGGLWTINMMGQPAHAAIWKKQLVIAQMPDVTKAIKESTEGIGDKLASSDKKALDGLDLFVWVDGDRLLKLVKPMLDGFMAPALAMQQSTGGFQAKSAEMNKKNIDMMVEGLKSLTIGVSLDDGGLGLRFAMTTKPGTDLAKQWRMKNTSGSLLQGLPASRYVMAFGQTVDPAQTKASLEGLDDMFAMGEDVEEVDPEKMKKLQGLIEEAAPMLTGLRGMIEPLPPGPEGLVGIGLVIDTTDSKKLLDLKAKFVDLGLEMLADAAAKTEDEELGQFRDAIAYNKEAEEIAGVQVQHFSIDLAKFDDIDEEDREDIFKVIGKDGVLFRGAPVNSKRIVLSFGGGKDRMAYLMKQALDSGAPLDADAGIKKVSARLPKERAQVGYIAADRMLALVNKVMVTLEEEPLPVQMPPINAPLAMVGSGGDGWIRGDLIVPTELLIALKNAAMTMMGTVAGPPPTTPPGDSSGG